MGNTANYESGTLYALQSVLTIWSFWKKRITRMRHCLPISQVDPMSVIITKYVLGGGMMHRIHCLPCAYMRAGLFFIYITVLHRQQGSWFTISNTDCLNKISTESMNIKHICMHLNELNYEKLRSWVAGIDQLSPIGGAPEPMSVQWVSTLHPPSLPHQMDQRERILGL